MIYVVSDLHGQYELFRRLLQKINFNQNDFMYILGDVIDRGPKPIQLLRDIMATPNMELLIGNHEYMMIKAITPSGEVADIEDFLLWANYNSGDITYNQLLQLPEAERINIYNYLLKRKLTTKIDINGKSYVLTHACPALNYIDIPMEDIPMDEIWGYVWKSPYRKGDETEASFSEYPSDMTTIMGHVPVVSYYHKELTPLLNMYTMDIDGGCAKCGDHEADYTGVMIYDITNDKTYSYSFEQLIEDLLDEDAPDRVFIDALGIYTAAPILNMRNKYSKYIN